MSGEGAWILPGDRVLTGRSRKMTHGVDLLVTMSVDTTTPQKVVKAHELVAAFITSLPQDVLKHLRRQVGNGATTISVPNAHGN